MGKRIQEQDFFARSAEEVARDLLGKAIICKASGESYLITETEAYYCDETGSNGKPICYGAGKTKVTAKGLVCSALFEQPGTWCIYGGQLLLSVTDNEHPDNVLIKEIKSKSGKVFGPNDMAKTALHLYKSYPDYCGCHGQFSRSEDSALYLSDGVEPSEIHCCGRINVSSDKKFRFTMKG